MINNIDYPVNAVLLIGPTGVGKSPLGDRFANSGFLGRTAHHLDFGRALWSSLIEADPASYTSDELRFIGCVLDHGLLLENEHFPPRLQSINQPT